MTSEEADRAARIAWIEQIEGVLVENRLIELKLKPIQGDFDIAHLKAIHAYSFQDLPRYRPGVTREDTHDWTKVRTLERGGDPYRVTYILVCSARMRVAN